MIYELKPGSRPTRRSTPTTTISGGPIPWSALSGLTEMPGVAGKLQAVWDSFYAQSNIFTVDVTQTPARDRAAPSPITRAGGTATNFDPEGLAYAPDGSTCGSPAKATPPTPGPTG